MSDRLGNNGPIDWLLRLLGGSPVPGAPERVNYRPPVREEIPAFPTLIPSANFREQYVKSSLASSALNVAQYGARGFSQSGVIGPTFRGLNYEPPTGAQRAFESASGLQGAGETLARQTGNRTIPSPFLWLYSLPFFQELFDQSRPRQA